MNKLFLAVVAGLVCFTAGAQHKKVSEFYLSYFNKDYMVTACPAEYSPFLKYDYEFDAECLGELDMVGIRVAHIRVDRFRNSMRKLVEEYDRWCGETAGGKLWAEKTSSVSFPKVDVYVYSDEGWILKPRMRLRGRMKAEDDCRYMIVETTDFHTSDSFGPQTARLIFSSADEIAEFNTGFDELLIAGPESVTIRENLTTRENGRRNKTFDNYSDLK